MSNQFAFLLIGAVARARTNLVRLA